MKSPVTAIIVALTASLAAAASDPLAGRWAVGDGGAVLDIVEMPGVGGNLEIRWVDGPDFSILPGTPIGVACSTSEAGKYDCRVTTDPRRARSPARKVDFVLELDGNTGDSFSMSHYRRGRRVTLWRWLPYLFRMSISNSEVPAGLDGARRVDAPPSYVVL